MRRIPAPLMKQSWRTIPVSRRRREGYRAGTSSGFEPPERVTSPYHRLKTRGAILAEDATPPTKGPVGEFGVKRRRPGIGRDPVSYTHLRAHETGRNLVCRLLL